MLLKLLLVHALFVFHKKHIAASNLKLLQNETRRMEVLYSCSSRSATKLYY